jgi:hypothetical protein
MREALKVVRDLAWDMRSEEMDTAYMYMKNKAYDRDLSREMQRAHALAASEYKEDVIKRYIEKAIKEAVVSRDHTIEVRAEIANMITAMDAVRRAAIRAREGVAKKEAQKKENIIEYARRLPVDERMIIIREIAAGEQKEG